MTVPLGEPGTYGGNRLYKTAVATTTALNFNALPLAFDYVPSGQVWSGSVYCAGPQPNAGVFAVYRDNQYLGTFTGTGGTLTGVQVADGQQLLVTGSGLGSGGALPVPTGAQVTVALAGRMDPIGSAPILTPATVGPAGAQNVLAQYAGVPGIRQGNITGQGSSIIGTIVPNAGTTWRLWAVNLSASLIATTANVSGAARMIKIQDQNLNVYMSLAFASLSGAFSKDQVSTLDFQGFTLPVLARIDLATDTGVTGQGLVASATVLYSPA